MGDEEFARVGFFGRDVVEEVEKEGDGKGQGMTAWTPSHRRVFVMLTFSSDALIILTPAEPLAGGNVTSIGRGLGGRAGIGG